MIRDVSFSAIDHLATMAVLDRFGQRAQGLLTAALGFARYTSTQKSTKSFKSDL